MNEGKSDHQYHQHEPLKILPGANKELLEFAFKKHESSLLYKSIVRRLGRLIIPHDVLRNFLCIPEGMTLKSTYTDPMFDGLVCLLEGEELPLVLENQVIPIIHLRFIPCDTCGNPQYVELLEGFSYE
jgi:hypothetical protein